MNKKPFLLISLLFLSSCTGFEFYQAAYNSIAGTVIPNNYSPISEDYFLAQKYSFAMVKIGNKDPITMVLQTTKDNIYRWVSADAEVIVTNKAGRIIKTIGLSHDVDYISLEKVDLFSLEKKITVKKLISFDYPELLKIKGIEHYEPDSNLYNYSYLQGKSIEVQKVNFLTEVPLISWSTDGFILLSNERVLASSQHIHPHFPRIDIYFYFK